jgi:hypothetical protein
VPPQAGPSLNLGNIVPIYVDDLVTAFDPVVRASVARPDLFAHESNTTLSKETQDGILHSLREKLNGAYTAANDILSKRPDSSAELKLGEVYAKNVGLAGNAAVDLGDFATILEVQADRLGKKRRPAQEIDELHPARWVSEDLYSGVSAALFGAWEQTYKAWASKYLAHGQGQRFAGEDATFYDAMWEGLRLILYATPVFAAFRGATRAVSEAATEAAIRAQALGALHPRTVIPEAVSSFASARLQDAAIHRTPFAGLALLLRGQDPSFREQITHKLLSSPQPEVAVQGSDGKWVESGGKGTEGALRAATVSPVSRSDQLSRVAQSVSALTLLAGPSPIPNIAAAGISGAAVSGHLANRVFLQSRRPSRVGGRGGLVQGIGLPRGALLPTAGVKRKRDKKRDPDSPEPERWKSLRTP